MTLLRPFQDEEWAIAVSDRIAFRLRADL